MNSRAHTYPLDPKSFLRTPDAGITSPCIWGLFPILHQSSSLKVSLMEASQMQLYSCAPDILCAAKILGPWGTLRGTTLLSWIHEEAPPSGLARGFPRGEKELMMEKKSSFMVLPPLPTRLRADQPIKD